MAVYEFKFVVSDVELTPEQHDRIGQAVAQAGALALSGSTPPEALTVRLAPNHWWVGIPPEALTKQLQEIALRKAATR
ncbi:MAG TPA: hypothetical protein VLW53_15530 [Candidatus Eisenbacteria bacterium]|nr:hypothetical protein [Candidatus Eisenbacteria bacterium]